MQFSDIFRAFINQAREETEPSEKWDGECPYERAMLKRLVSAIDNQSEKELLTTVLQMKAELDALDRSALTILPSVVDMLAGTARASVRQAMTTSFRIPAVGNNWTAITLRSILPAALILRFDFWFAVLN
jgi:hypothetical protein